MLSEVPDVSEALITCVTAAVTVGAMDWKDQWEPGPAGMQQDDYM